MSRLIAIGDIHGHLDKLAGLVGQIAPTADSRLVFLGAYIDRGSSSFEVVDILQVKHELPYMVLLRGNHEDFVLSHA
ncbi:MAG: metallophosphoesterase [Nitrospirae bacterium]|nr:metallophosphoesterase [Nitrospirota bacterium]MBI5694931.1 metallophosphoesterase [Nitrospirota bacterium]